MFTVLLVDDEELVRVSVGFSVRGAMSGVQVIGEAANGLEGLKRIREEHPDIVITDIRMPKLDGLQMIRAIREESLDIEVVVLSGYADFEYARQAMKYGVTEYLLKPVESENLRETLEEGCCALALAWSGNWTCTAFPWGESYCDYRPWTYCCVMGLTDGAFFRDVLPGESFTTPEVYLSQAGDREEACLAGSSTRRSSRRTRRLPKAWASGTP